MWTNMHNIINRTICCLLQVLKNGLSKSTMYYSIYLQMVIILACRHPLYLCKSYRFAEYIEKYQIYRSRFLFSFHSQSAINNVCSRSFFSLDIGTSDVYMYPWTIKKCMYVLTSDEPVNKNANPLFIAIVGRKSYICQCNIIKREVIE